MQAIPIVLKPDEIDLAARLYLPPDNGARHPTLCICHGLPSGIPNPVDDGGYPLLAEKFCAAGFVTLIFSFRGCGESEGNLDMTGWAHDLSAAVTFLHDRREVDVNRISVMGFSAGAAITILVAAGDTRIGFVISCACPTNFSFLSQNPSELVQHFRGIGLIRDKDFPRSLNEWFDGMTKISPLGSIGRIAPRPILLVHGDLDELVPLENAKQLYKAAGEPKELAVIAGGKHRLRTDHAAMTRALHWLTANTANH